MSETFFPTSTPATIEELETKINALQNDLSYCKSTSYHLMVKIENVRDIIVDSFDGSHYDEILMAIAEILDIPLTKTIQGEGSINFSYTAVVPLDFDESTLDFSVYVDESFDAEEFAVDITYTDWGVDH